MVDNPVPARQGEPLIFPQTVEALFIRGLAGRLDQNAKAGLRALGLDLDRPLLPAYPADVFAKAADLAARLCYPDKSIEEAYFLLGERTIHGMDETLVGKAQMALARLVGPMRALLTVPKNTKGSSNFVSATVTPDGPTSVVSETHGYRLPYPDFQLGTLLAVVKVCGGKEPRGEILHFDREKLTVTVRISWK